MANYFSWPAIALLACTLLARTTASAQPASRAPPHHDHEAPLAADAAFADIAVDFELLDRDGRLVRDEDFRGRYVLLAFGFTRCPDVCPLMAFTIASALQAADRDAVGIFVSVDTERDSPAAADDYARGFDRRILGLGGSYERVNAAARNFRASYAVTKTQNAYTVQHTAHIYLIGPAGELLDTVAPNTPPAEIVGRLR